MKPPTDLNKETTQDGNPLRGSTMKASANLITEAIGRRKPLGDPKLSPRSIQIQKQFIFEIHWGSENQAPK